MVLQDDSDSDQACRHSHYVSELHQFNQIMTEPMSSSEEKDASTHEPGVTLGVPITRHF